MLVCLSMSLAHLQARETSRDISEKQQLLGWIFRCGRTSDSVPPTVFTGIHFADTAKNRESDAAYISLIPRAQPTQYFLCDPSHLEGLQTNFLINISKIMFHKVKGSPRRWWREIPGWQLCSCPDQNRIGDSSKKMQLMDYLLGLNVLRGPWHLQWRVWRWIDGRYVELSRWTKSTIIHSKENRNRKDLSSFYTSILSFGLC